MSVAVSSSYAGAVIATYLLCHRKVDACGRQSSSADPHSCSVADSTYLASDRARRGCEQDWRVVIHFDSILGSGQGTSLTVYQGEAVAVPRLPLPVVVAQIRRTRSSAASLVMPCSHSSTTSLKLPCWAGQSMILTARFRRSGLRSHLGWHSGGTRSSLSAEFEPLRTARERCCSFSSRGLSLVC